MKKKNVMMVCICVIVTVFFISCGKKDSTDYVDGTIEEGKTIESYYTLDGPTTRMVMSGGFDSVPLEVANTKDGGVVAWKSNKYSYSKTASKSAVALHLAEKGFGMKPTKASWF